MFDLQERYVASLMPLQKSISPWKVRQIFCFFFIFRSFPFRWINLATFKDTHNVPSLISQSPPQLRPFNQEEFMKTLEKAGPQLTSRLKGDWIGLYRYSSSHRFDIYIYVKVFTLNASELFQLFWSRAGSSWGLRTSMAGSGTAGRRWCRSWKLFIWRRSVRKTYSCGYRNTRRWRRSIWCSNSRRNWYFSHSVCITTTVVYLMWTSHQLCIHTLIFMQLWDTA